MLYGTVIVVKQNGQDGSEFPITERIVEIGASSQCRIIIDRPYVSNVHCQLVLQDDGQMKVYNLSTANPTLVNGDLVEPEASLAHGDVLEIGGRLLRWEYFKDSPFYKEPCKLSEMQSGGKNNLEEAPKPGSSIAADAPALPQSDDSGAADLPTSTDSAQLDSSAVPIAPIIESLPSTPTNPKKIIRLTPQVVNIIKGRNSLHVPKGLYSPVNNRRKSDIIKGLSAEDLNKIANVNGRPSILRTPGKSALLVKAADSPFTEASLRNNVGKPPLFETIGECQPVTENHVKASEYAEPDSTNDPPDIDLNLTANEDTIPSTPSSSLSRTPEKSLTDMDEVPETPKEPIVADQVCFETPPEVKTPAESPEPEGRASPKTPKSIARVLAIESVETPPEVVTPETFSPFKKPRLSPSVRKTPNRTPRKQVEQTPSPLRSSKRTTPVFKTPPSTRKSSPAKTPVKEAPTSAKKPSQNLVKSPTPRKQVRSPIVVKTPTPKKRMATPAKSPAKRVKSPSVAKTPSPARKIPSPRSARKKQTSPKSAKTEKTPSPKRSVKKTEPTLDRPTTQLRKGKLRKSLLRTKVAKAFGLKSKVQSAPDKSKNKALLVLGKAVESKSQTQTNMRKKLLKKAIETKNRKMKMLAVKPPTDEKSSPVRRTPQKTPKVNTPPSPAKPNPRKTPKTKPAPSPGVRSSKRINSTQGYSRPDFTELSPSALGLAPRLTSSATKSPAKNRKHAASRTPRKSLLYDPDESSQETSEVFSSPLGTPRQGKIDASFQLMEFYTPVANSSPRKVRGSVAKDPFAIPEETVAVVSPKQTPIASSKTTAKSRVRVQKSPANSYEDVTGVKNLFSRKSPRNDLTKVTSIRKLMKTPPAKRVKKPVVVRAVKSPKNDLTQIRSIRKLMKTPPQKRVKKPTVTRPVRSPKNDLTDVRGVKEMFLAKEQSSPIVAGVKRILAHSPKNDLSDVRGVQSLMRTPKNSRSPEHQLESPSGLKQLFATPPNPESAAPLTAKKRVGTAIDTPKAVGTPLRRGRSSNVAATVTPLARSLRTRTDTLTDTDEVQVSTPVPTRGRRKAVVKSENDEPVSSATLPKKGRRAAKTKVPAEETKENGIPTPPKRGRRAAPKATVKKEISAEEIPQNEVVTSPAPPKKGRRAAAAANDPEAPTQQARSRRGREKMDIAVEKTKQQVTFKESPSSSPSPKKRATRAKVQTETTKQRGAKAPAKKSTSRKKQTRPVSAQPKRATRSTAAAAAK